MVVWCGVVVHEEKQSQCSATLTTLEANDVQDVKLRDRARSDLSYQLPTKGSNQSAFFGAVPAPPACVNVKFRIQNWKRRWKLVAVACRL